MRSKQQRAMEIATGKKRPFGLFGLSNPTYDKSIDEGMQDEDASAEHQKKIQGARKKRDWRSVRRMSEEWGKMTDSKGRGRFR